MNNIKEIYQKYRKSSGISTDSRNISENCMFVALKGENFDANNYVEQAIEKGAKYALTSNADIASDNILYTDDTLKTLQELAKYHRKQLNIPIIGITGSNGKTTTKELIYATLSKKYNTFATKGNFNNHIGVPLSILSIKPEVEIAVIEMGANHIGEIDLLCNISQPNYGIITNVGHAHIEGFGSFEGVKIAKGELYKYIQNNQGNIFINSTNNNLNNMCGHYENIIFYAGIEDKVYCKEVLNADPLSLIVYIDGKEYTIKTKITGTYNVENIIAAIRIASYFEVDTMQIISAIEEFESTNRSQIVEGDNNKILLDAYNANPSSMKAAIENFATINHPNKALILGEMKELGADSDAEHYNIIQQIKKHQFKTVLLVGENYYPFINDDEDLSSISYIKSTNELKDYLKENKFTNTYILVKGSRSNKLEETIEYLK